jgi:para-nitrobenzyl esterase
MTMRQAYGIFMLMAVAALGACAERDPSTIGGQALRNVDCSEPVVAAAGTLTGVRERETCAFKGLPFAEPPVGARRFQPPQPLAAKLGNFKAEKFGNQCLQTAGDAVVGAEDCLTLNVWLPGATSDGRRAEKLPVMVFIHGGAYVSGGASVPLYDGEYLAAKGVVLVTVNYRLGALGYLAPSSVTDSDGTRLVGNLGPRDQIAALQWVRANITAFGGDPHNVTIFGESAGAGSVCVLLASPKAAGLFQRAIMESGGCQIGERDDVAAKADAWIISAGCAATSPATLACLRSLDAATFPVAAPYSMVNLGGIHPNVDGDVVEAQPLAELRAGRSSSVAVMAGYNKEETYGLRFLPGNEEFVRQTYAQFWARARNALGDGGAEKLRRQYGYLTHRDAMELTTGIMDDWNFACAAYDVLAAQRKAGAQTYYYRFSFGENELTLESVAGTFHGAELPFVFGTVRALVVIYPGDAAFRRALALSEQTQRYWVRFASTGDPNGGGDPYWPAFDDGDARMELAPNPVVSRERQGERCAFWTQIDPPDFGGHFVFMKSVLGFQPID